MNNCVIEIIATSFVLLFVVSLIKKGSLVISFSERSLPSSVFLECRLRERTAAICVVFLEDFVSLRNAYVIEKIKGSLNCVRILSILFLSGWPP